MKSINEMTPEEIRALKPGEEVQTRTERSAEFRFFMADAANVLVAPPYNVVVSFIRAEARDVTTVSVVQAPPAGGGLSVTQKSVNARPVMLEEAQVRLSPDAATDIGIAMLFNVMQFAPDLVRQKLAAFPALQQALVNDAAKSE